MEVECADADSSGTATAPRGTEPTPGAGINDTSSDFAASGVTAAPMLGLLAAAAVGMAVM
jgi:hypothetical protein